VSEGPRKPAANPVKRAYQAVFFAPNGDTPDAQRRVLSDIVKFCAAGRSPVVFDPSGKVDADATLVAVGRQEVWHHINQVLNIPDRDIVRLAIPQRDASVPPEFEP
jgi:hypothetical protein